MVNGDRKEGICRLNVDGNGCDYLRILSDLETKLRNNTNPKEKIELALQGALMFYGADRAYVIEVDDELGIGVNTYECCAPGIAPEIDNLQFMPFEMFPRWLCSLKSDTPIIITDLEQIKTEFLEEYRYFWRFRFKKDSMPVFSAWIIRNAMWKIRGFYDLLSFASLWS